MRIINNVITTSASEKIVDGQPVAPFTPNLLVYFRAYKYMCNKELDKDDLKVFKNFRSSARQVLKKGLSDINLYQEVIYRTAKGEFGKDKTAIQTQEKTSYLKTTSASDLYTAYEEAIRAYDEYMLSHNLEPWPKTQVE
ncbi:MAG: hypothetical protein HXX11_17265 [Desulfuromonadales bacterium]|nr:hypothetical protein [Desulfuromonadales bacterium]